MRGGGTDGGVGVTREGGGQCTCASAPQPGAANLPKSEQNEWEEPQKSKNRRWESAESRETDAKTLQKSRSSGFRLAEKRPERRGGSLMSTI